MADQQQQRPYNEGNPAPPAREIYQYAFDYSEPSSRSGSYIEPDVRCSFHITLFVSFDLMMTINARTISPRPNACA